MPLALVGARLWYLPIDLVYLPAMRDEITKLAISHWRTRSMRWIHVVAEVRM